MTDVMTFDKRDHYNENGIETKEIIKLVSDQMGDNITGYQGFCIGNVLKYITRFYKKGGSADIEKAQVYLQYLYDTVYQKEVKEKTDKILKEIENRNIIKIEKGTLKLDIDD